MTQEMKKFLLLLFSAFICILCFADEINLEPKQNGDSTGGKRVPALYPTATYESGSVTIYAPYYIDSMTMVIADSNEDVIYTVNLGGFMGQQSIVLPDEVDADKYSISLYFNGICLYGLF